jgi:hypothetical protein
MTERNSGSASALWDFWDAVRLNETTSMGWWEDDLPVLLNYSSSATRSENEMPGDCAAWNETVNGYYDGDPCGQPSGNLGCWPNPQSLAVTQAACCANPACAGFSAVPAGAGLITGCYKRSQSCFRSDPGASGYYKPGFVPPPDPNSAVLATTYSAFGSRAVIVIASYFPSSTVVTLSIDYAALGLVLGQVNMTAPAISGVQTGQAFADPSGPYTVPASGGIILLLE